MPALHGTRAFSLGWLGTAVLCLGFLMLLSVPVYVIEWLLHLFN
jgi:hypothetical protein